MSDGYSRYCDDYAEYQEVCKLFGVKPKNGSGGINSSHYYELQEKARQLREAKRKIMNGGVDD